MDVLGRMEKDFEEAIRSSFGRESMEYYTPYLEYAKKKGTKCFVLDLECGMGKWLEVLQGMKIAATGIDSSRECVRVCQRKGLAVNYGTPLCHLPHVMSMSVDVVSMLHGVMAASLVELDEIFRESCRILSDDGIFMAGGMSLSTSLDRLPRIARRLQKAGFLKVEIHGEEVQGNVLQGMNIQFPDMEKRLYGFEYVIIGYKGNTEEDK